MLAELIVIDLFSLNAILSYEDLFNLDYIVGILILISIFPFIAKSILVYFKIERKDEGEKFQSTKYYQLLILEHIIFNIFMICIWWLALILSCISSFVILCANKIMIKTDSKREN